MPWPRQGPVPLVPISEQLPGHRELRRLAPGAEQTEARGHLGGVRAELLVPHEGAVQVVEEGRVALRRRLVRREGRDYRSEGPPVQPTGSGRRPSRMAAEHGRVAVAQTGAHH